MQQVEGVKNGALRLRKKNRIDEKSIFRQVVGHILLTILSFYSDLSEVDALRVKSVDVSTENRTQIFREAL